MALPPSQPFQPTQFQPVTVYDAPGVMFQQLLDNELTFEGIKNTLFQSHLLTPDERMGFSQELKAKVGSDDPVTGTLIDLATNPWVWFAFLTTPGVPSAIKRGTTTIFEGSRYGAFVREKAPLLMSLGFWNANAHFRNSATGEALTQAARINQGFMEHMARQSSTVEQTIIHNLNKRGIKIDSLDPDQVPIKYQEVVKEINMVRYAAANGFDKNTSHWIPKAQAEYRVQWYNQDPSTGVRTPIEGPSKTGAYSSVAMQGRSDAMAQFQSGTRTLKEVDHSKLQQLKAQSERLSASVMGPHPVGAQIEVVDITRMKDPLKAGIQAEEELVPRVVNGTILQRKIDEWGLAPLIESDRRNLDWMFMKLYGHESVLSRFGGDSSAAIQAFREGNLTIKELVDDNKLMRIWRSSSNDALVQKYTDPFTGDEVSVTAGKRLISEFFNFNPHQIDSLAPTEFKNKVLDVFDVHLKNEKYFPFGLREHVDRSLKPVYGRGRQAKIDRAAVAAGMSLPRVSHPKEHIFHPDDIEQLYKLAGDDGDALMAIGKLENRTQDVLAKLESGQAISIRRMNADKSLSLYKQRAAETYALHVAGVESRALGEGRVALDYDPAVWKNMDDLQALQARELQRTASGQERAGVPVYGADPWGVSFGQGRVDSRFMEMAERDMKSHGGKISTFDKEGKELWAATESPTGGWSIADVLNQGYKGMDQTQEMSKELMTEVLIPRLMGRRTLEEMSNFSISAFVKWAANSLADSPIGKAIEKSGDFGTSFVAGLKRAGSEKSVFNAPRMASGHVAKHLYVTHLGANMASVVLNATQPWMHGATWLGVDSILYGYKEAFREMGAYLKKRSQTGKILLPDDQRMKMINESFIHAKDDLLGIGPDVYALQDAIAFGGRGGIRSPATKAIYDIPMKAFEKAEWLNRLVIAHGTDHAFKKMGRYTDDVASADYRFRMRTTKTMVEETQFGGNLLNTPTIFLGKGIIGGIGDSPVVRQFLTFPTRTVMGFLHTAGEIGGGARKMKWMGNEVDMGNWGYVGGAAPKLFDFARGLGIASILYYTGKNFLDANLSRGLVANASTDVFGGRDFLEDGEYDWFPAPPAWDIMFQGARGLLGGDGEILRRQIPRMIPGGVAAARLVGTAPPGLVGKDNWLGDLASNMQRSYADYGNPTPDGLVPFYKGDGTFVDFRKPADLIFQGLGMDLGRSQVKGELDGYLVNQREQILEARNGFLSALFSNNIGRAMGIKEEFEKRFNIPLTITKENLRSRMRNRNISRAERIADRLPPEARHLYTPYLGARGKEMGMDPSAYDPERDLTTSTARSKEFARPQNYDLDPETVKVLKEMVEASKKEKPLKERSFTHSYVPYDWR